MQQTAIDITGPSTDGFNVGFDFRSGAGFIQADKAVLASSIVSMSLTVAPSVACAPGSSTVVAQVLGGLAPYIYSWQASAGVISSSTTATAIVSNMPAGTQVVSLTVTDANGMTLSATTSLTVNASPTAGISSASATLTCSSPSVSLTASGGGTGGPFSYVWNDNTTNAIRPVSAAGTYSVTVTAANGCTATTSVNIGEDKTVPTASISPTSATLTCASPGPTLTASGGSTYLWSTGATTPAISVTTAGSYSVTVTTGGCAATASANVSGSNSVSAP